MDRDVCMFRQSCVNVLYAALNSLQNDSLESLTNQLRLFLVDQFLLCETCEGLLAFYTLHVGGETG